MQQQQIPEHPPLQEDRSSGNLRTQQDGAPWTEMDQLDSPEHRLLKVLPSYVSHLKPDLAAAVTQDLLTDANATMSDIDNLPVRVSSTILRKVLAPHALAQAERHSWGLAEAGRPQSYTTQRTQRSSAPVLGQSSSHSGAAPAAPPRAYSVPMHRPPVGPSMLGPQHTRVLQPMQLSATGVQPLSPAQQGFFMMPMPPQQQPPGLTPQGSSSTMLYASQAPPGSVYAPQYSGSMVAVQQQQRLLREALTLRTSRDGDPSSEPLPAFTHAGRSQQQQPSNEAGPGMRVVSEGGVWPITSLGGSPSPSSSPWQLSSSQSTPRTLQAYSQLGASDASLDRSGPLGMLPAPPLPQAPNMQQQQVNNRAFLPLQVHVADPASATPSGPPVTSQFTLDVQHAGQAMSGADPTVFAYQQVPLRAPLSAGSGSAASPNPSTTGSQDDPERMMDRPGIGRYPSDLLAPGGSVPLRPPFASIFEARHSLASTDHASERASTAYTDRQSTVTFTERQSTFTDRSSAPLTDRSSAQADRVSWGDNVSTSSSINSTIHGSATSLPLYGRKEAAAGDLGKMLPTQHKSAATWDAISPALHRDVQLLQAQTHASVYSQPPRSPKADPLVQSGSSAGTATTSVLGSPSTDINLSAHSGVLSKLGKGLASDTEEADLSSTHLTSMPSSSLSYMGTPRGLADASSRQQGEHSSTVSLLATSGNSGSTSTAVTATSTFEKGIQVGGHDELSTEVHTEPVLGPHGWSSTAHVFSSTGIGTLEEAGTHEEDEEDSNPEEDVGKEVMLLLRRHYPQLAPALHQVLTASTVVSDQELLRLAAASRASQPRALEQVSTRALQTLMEEHSRLQNRIRDLESQLAAAPSTTSRAPGSPSASSSGQRYSHLQVRTQLSHSSGRSSTWQQAKREALAAATSVGSAGIGGVDRDMTGAMSTQSSVQSAAGSIGAAQSLALTERASTGSASIPLNLLLSSRLDLTAPSGGGAETSRASEAGTEVTFARSLPGSSANSSANSRRQAVNSASAGANTLSEEAHGGSHMFSPRPSLGSSSASHGSRAQEGSTGSNGRPSNSGSHGHRGSSSSGSAQLSGTHLASIADVVVPEESNIVSAVPGEDPEVLGSPSASGPSATASSISFRPGHSPLVQGTPPMTWASLLSRSGTGVDRPGSHSMAPDSPGPPSGSAPVSATIVTAPSTAMTVADWDNGSRHPAGVPASDQEGVSSSSSADVAPRDGPKGCWPSSCRTC